MSVPPVAINGPEPPNNVYWPVSSLTEATSPVSSTPLPFASSNTVAPKISSSDTLPTSAVVPVGVPSAGTEAASTVTKVTGDGWLALPAASVAMTVSLWTPAATTPSMV